MFSSSAVLEETFPSDGDGNEIKGRYAINAITGFNWRKGNVETFFWRSRFNWRKGDVAAFSGVQMEIGVEDYIRDEVLRIIFCSCVTLDFG